VVTIGAGISDFREHEMKILIHYFHSRNERIILCAVEEAEAEGGL
jgi:hypothetical protein